MPIETQQVIDLWRFNHPKQIFDIPPEERGNTAFKVIEDYNRENLEQIQESYLGNKIDLFA